MRGRRKYRVPAVTRSGEGGATDVEELIVGEVVHGLGSGDKVIGSKGVPEDGREIGDVGGDGSWAGHCRGCEMMCFASSLPNAYFPTRFR